MNGATFALALTVSHGLAAAANLALALRSLVGLRGDLRAVALLAALGVTAAWAALIVAMAQRWIPVTPLVGAVDALRYLAWFAFVATLLRGGGRGTAGGRTLLVVAAAIALACALAVVVPRAWVQDLGPDAPRALIALWTGLAVCGLAVLEQLARRTGAQSRWAVRPLLLALGALFGFDLVVFADGSLFGALVVGGALFGFDLVVFADGSLFGALDPALVIARGAAAAFVVPLLALASVRNPSWSIDLHLSREAAFHSTALVVSGAFLLVVAGTGYLVRYFAGDWGRALSIEVAFALLLGGAAVATSGRFRSRLRVFIGKHFFSYRYDYRQEWLRVTRALAVEPAGQRLEERVIGALADLTESPGGMLWLKEEDGSFRPAARRNLPAIQAAEPADGSLPAFLARTGWVVTLGEALAHPERYRGLALPGWLADLPEAWLVVPLDTGLELAGFVVLSTPRAAVEVDWEVRDLLKTAGRQAAASLGHVRAAEALLEARKFEAFNRMSAFVVHDLKNLVAQLSLMARNAERHQDNPAFQQDMLNTVRHVVGRMNELMAQVRAGGEPVDKPHPVDVARVVRRVVAAKGAPERLAVEESAAPLALGHEDRLEHVLAHVVQNALDATSEGGRVAVRIAVDEPWATLDVSDTGVGMTPEFVRERLYRPFQSTKRSGMGIGVYQAAKYVEGLGGRIEIESAPGAGTRVRVRLPLPAVAARPAVEEPA